MKKSLKYYLNLNYPISVETYTENEETGYALEIPDLPGCGADGKTLNEAMKSLQEAKELWISASLKRNLSIPEPVSEKDFSGKFLLRIPVKLHMALAKQAKRESQSLNQYVRSILERHIYRILPVEQVTRMTTLPFLEEEFMNSASNSATCTFEEGHQRGERPMLLAAGGVI